MKILKKKIIKIQKNKGAYLFVDKVLFVKPEKKIEGFYNLKKDLWFFKEHWPGDPNMPGALQLEAMTQMSSLIFFCLKENYQKTFYLVSIDNSRFFKKVTPNFGKLFVKSKVLNNTRGLVTFEAVAYILNKKNTEKVVCKSQFKLVLR